MKKLLLLLLAMCAIHFTWAAYYHFSAVAPTGQTLYYYINSGTTTVKVTYPGVSTSDPYSGYTYPSGDLEVPSTVTNNGTTYSVTSIGDYAFRNCQYLTSVTIPNSVTSISNYAFYDCRAITSVAIPNSVTTIGERTFGNCIALTSATIPNSVISISNYAFYGCYNLTSVTIPNSITSIGAYVFSGCSALTNVTIPNSVTSIGGYAFQGCSSLTSVTIPNSVTSIGMYAFYNCSHLNNVTIPNTVTTIGSSAFYGVTTVMYCGTATGSPWSARRSGCFEVDGDFIYSDNTHSVLMGYTGVESSVTIPNSVTSIESYAFYNCALNNVVIPNSVTSIGESAFSGVTTVMYCGTATGTPWNARRSGCFEVDEDFIYSDNTHTVLLGYTGEGGGVTIPNSVTSIGERTFYNCSSLTNATIGNSVTSIGNYAFYGCNSLASVTIGNSVTSINNNAFYNCSALTSVTIPNSVTSIGNNAFEGCSSLTIATIGNSVTTIKGRAFYNCSALTNVTIGNSVTSIGDYAFGGSSSIRTVYNLSNMTITKGSTSNGYVAFYAKRVIKPMKSGTGANTLYQIPESYSFVDAEDGVEMNIPRATIPNIDNLIYKDGTTWKAKNVVLTDGQDAFEAPVEFSADSAIYVREFTNGNRNTLYLPFSAAVPSVFEVYDFAGYANNTISFTEHEGNIAAYTPYLVGYDLSKASTQCTITATNAVFPKSETDNYHPVTYNGMTFQGVIERTQMSPDNYGYSNGYFVRSGGNAHVNPFRCYFTVSGSTPASTLSIDILEGEVGIDKIEETPESHIRYSNDVYDMMGRLVRKNAENLQGLPQGIYIWRGEKVFAY